MTQELVINLVPFEIKSKDLKVFFQKTENSIPERSVASSFSFGIDADRESSSKIAWDISSFTGAEEFTFNVETNHRATKRFVNRLLRKYFLSKNLLVSSDFIDGITVYEKEQDGRASDFEPYKKFSVQVIAPKQQNACHRNSWCINIAYFGVTEIAKKPLSTYTTVQQTIAKVVVGNEVASIHNISEQSKAANTTRPLLSFEMRSALGMTHAPVRSTNKYGRFYDESVRFYDRHLKGVEIEDIVSIYESGFQPINESQIITTTKDSNLLVFSENHTHFNPYNGLKEYGPYQAVTGDDYRFFFIFHEEDREHANKLYGYLTKGLKGFPGIFRFSGVEVKLDRDKTIHFSEEDPIEQISQKLNELSFDPNTRYLAIYISRIKKDDSDEDRRDVYFKLKKLLLEKNISSQVVHKWNIDNPNFNYFLPNIAVAVLAKLGGIPWRLSRPIKHDLIVGIGAFREGDHLYLGTTVAFKNDGTFVRFDSSKVDTVDGLIQFFKKALSDVAKEQTEIKRIVVHYYKTMNSEEESAIRKALDDLGLKIPYIVLHITEDSDFVPFDLSYQGRMPTSGTCVVLRKGDYLLCNNTRYAHQTGSKIDDFPFPVRIKVSKASIADLSKDDIQALIDQAYQFSRMYWISVKQKGKPVTVLYSEKVAKISAAFDNQQLPQSMVATQTLWFL
jgi:hypothetical protein